jgi:hypothetical protein
MNLNRYDTIKEPHSGSSKIFEWYRSLRMEHLVGLIMSGVFIVLVVSSAWYMLTLSERGESVDE